MIPTVKPLKQTPTSLRPMSEGFYEFACECICFWVCICIPQRLLKWVWGVERCARRGEGPWFVERAHPHCVALRSLCLYYLMTLCPEWETDPLWAKVWRKEELFQCILHSDFFAQHTALEVSLQSPRTLRIKKCPTCRLETNTVCMCFVFLSALRDRMTEKQ